MPTATPGPGRTLFVDGAIGDDARSAAQAMSRTTPWRTIGRALAEAIADDKIVVAPGTVRRPSTISSPRAERPAASSRLSPRSRLRSSSASTRDPSRAGRTPCSPARRRPARRPYVGRQVTTTSSGTSGPDVIVGLGGNDRLFGGRGDDVLRGGAGGRRLQRRRRPPRRRAARLRDQKRVP